MRYSFFTIFLCSLFLLLILAKQGAFSHSYSVFKVFNEVSNAKSRLIHNLRFAAEKSDFTFLNFATFRKVELR